MPHRFYPSRSRNFPDRPWWMRSVGSLVCLLWFVCCCYCLHIGWGVLMYLKKSSICIPASCYIAKEQTKLWTWHNFFSMAKTRTLSNLTTSPSNRCTFLSFRHFQDFRIEDGSTNFEKATGSRMLRFGEPGSFDYLDHLPLHEQAYHIGDPLDLLHTMGHHHCRHATRLLQPHDCIFYVLRWYRIQCTCWFIQ